MVFHCLLHTPDERTHLQLEEPVLQAVCSTVCTVRDAPKESRLTSSVFQISLGDLSPPICRAEIISPRWPVAVGLVCSHPETIHNIPMFL